MLDVFLCHSPADREVALQIAARLERTAEAKVLLDETGNIPLSWDGGLGSSAILLLLSPDAVPAKLNREEWEPLLAHVGGNAAPTVGFVLIRDCPFPRLLDRKSFFRWREPALETLRQIEMWAIAAHPERTAGSVQPATLSCHGGLEQELAQLWEWLVDDCGAVSLVGPARAGKTALAQQFAAVSFKHFRDVLWISCAERTLDSIASEIAWRVGMVLDGSTEEACVQLAQYLGTNRQLLILDGPECGVDALLPQGGYASVLVTTRVAAGGRRIDLLQPFEVPSRLPEQSREWNLWRAASACRGQDFPLGFAIEVAGLEEREGLAAAQKLSEHRLLDLFGAGRSRLVVSHRSPDREGHAKALHEAFRNWVKAPEGCVALLGEVEPAFRWALEHDWKMAVDLGRWSFGLLQLKRRTFEASERMESLLRHAESRGDEEVVTTAKWELSWIREGSEPKVRLPDEPAEQLSFGF